MIVRGQNLDSCTSQRMRCMAHSGLQDSLASRPSTLRILPMQPQKVLQTIMFEPTGTPIKFQYYSRTVRTTMVPINILKSSFLSRYSTHSMANHCEFTEMGFKCEIGSMSRIIVTLSCWFFRTEE